MAYTIRWVGWEQAETQWDRVCRNHGLIEYLRHDQEHPETPGGPSPFRIILSRHGELLTFDRTAGGLRFGSLATSPVNAVVPAESSFVERTGPTVDTFTDEPVRCDPHASGRLATLSGGGFNETVLLADGGLLTTLRHLAVGTWLRQTSQAELPHSGFLLHGLSWEADFVAVLDGLRIDLAASIALLSQPANPDALFVIDPQARVERLLRYDPVVAYTAFGPNMSLFRCLEASLYSLSRVAGFTGRVLVLSDRARADLEFLLPGELRPNAHFVQAPAQDVMAMALARYALPTLQVAQLARPLLYVDTDVIFDAPIERLLAEVTLAQRICVFAEDDLHHPMDFYGGTLIAADPSFKPRCSRGFSTGVMGIPDTGQAADPFRALLALADAHFERSGTRGSTSAFDQRFANYLFHKLVDYDDTTINRHETYCNGRDPDLGDRRGLAHFAGGVGNAEPKLARMTAYLAGLQQTG